MLSTISKSSMPPSHSIPVGISSSGNRPRLPAQSKMKRTANTGTRNPNKPTLGHIVPLSTPGSPGHVYSNVRCECCACNVLIKRALLDSDLLIGKKTTDPKQTAPSPTFVVISHAPTPNTFSDGMECDSNLER